MKSNRKSARILLALTLLGLAPQVPAVTDYWNNTSGGDFTNAANWISGVPSGSDTAYFTNNTGFLVSFSSSVTNRNASISQGSLAFNLGGNTWALTNSTVPLSPGTTVSVSNGAWTVSQAAGAGSWFVRLNPQGQSVAGLFVQDAATVTITNTQSNSLTFELGTTGINSGVALRVTGPGALLQAPQATIIVGVSNANNELTISNGGVASVGSVYVGGSFSYGSAMAMSNSVLIAGPNSTLQQNGTSDFTLGTSGGLNTLLATNGAVVKGARFLYIGKGVSSSNTATFSGSQLLVGGGSGGVDIGVFSSSGNSLILTDTSTAINISGSYGMCVGGSWTSAGLTNIGGSFNRLLITQGSTWSNTVLQPLYVGPYSSNNSVEISSGGAFITMGGDVEVGASTNIAYNNSILVTSGGLLQPNNKMVVGTASSGSGGNTISNLGGIFQFTSATPTITPNGVGSIVVSNGTISFRGITNANVAGSLGGSGGNQLTNILFQGRNTFRLNNASNFSANAQNYTFDAGSPSNYAGLEMINGGTAWKSAWLNVGAGGTMLVSNTSASVAAVLTNQGSLRVINSTVTWQSNVVIGGGYLSDPSTNTFLANATVTTNGYLQGSSGDLFVFQKDFINQSTNNSQFSLWQSAVLFTNSANHLLSISNSGSVNIGQGYTNFSQVVTNFAIGQLSIATGNRVTLAGSKDSLTNALYVGWLDIQGLATNSSFDNVTNGLFAALNLPNINLYYDKYDPRNDWLNNNLIGPEANGYELWGSGGGLLLPIPEPSLILLVAAGVAILVVVRRRV